MVVVGTATNRSGTKQSAFRTSDITPPTQLHPNQSLIAHPYVNDVRLLLAYWLQRSTTAECFWPYTTGSQQFQFRPATAQTREIILARFHSSRRLLPAPHSFSFSALGSRSPLRPRSLTPRLWHTDDVIDRRARPSTPLPGLPLVPTDKFESLRNLECFAKLAKLTSAM